MATTQAPCSLLLVALVLAACAEAPSPADDARVASALGMADASDAADLGDAADAGAAPPQTWRPVLSAWSVDPALVADGLTATDAADAQEEDAATADEGAASVADVADLAEAPDQGAADSPAPADSALTPTDSATDVPSDAALPSDATTSLAPGLQISGPVSCPAGSAPAGVFEDIAATLGIDLVRPQLWPVGTPEEGSIVREGGGTAAADFDGDGVVDFYFAVETGPDRIYLSGGKGPGQYQGVDVPAAGLYDASAVAADLDHDGDPDVLVGSDGIRILRNDGPGVFTDVTTQLGLAKPGQPLFSLSVADVDRDGMLDVLVLGHKFEKKPGVAGGGWPPQLYPNYLLHATGAWKYQDVSAWLPPAPSDGVGFIGSWFDADGDGDQDLYIVNDFGDLFQPNRFLRNDGVVAGKVSFTDASMTAGLDLAMAGMGCAVGDYDRDGDMDVYLTGYNGQNYFMKNSAGGAVWDDVTSATQTAKFGSKMVSWGTQFFDANNDGWLDLYYGNGYTPALFGGLCSDLATCQSMVKSGMNPPDQPDTFRLNMGDGTFQDASAESGLDDAASMRSVIQTDVDGDGFVDLVVGTISGTPRVFHNGCDASAWLEVRLTGVQDNRDGIGARVTVKAGGVVLIREIDAGSTGLWGSNEPMAHFGLGTATQVDELQVRWPGGQVQTFANLPVRRHVRVTQQP